MEIKAFICPQCGASLHPEDSATYTYCPNCGNKLHITYNEGEAKVNPDLRLFTAGEGGMVLGSAVVPKEYLLSGVLSNEWQSDLVPFQTKMRAAAPDESIVLISLSKEMFVDYRNPLVRNMVRNAPNVIRSCMKDYQTPENYLYAWASGMCGVQLRPSARAPLPSLYGRDPALASSALSVDFQIISTAESLFSLTLDNPHFESFLFRYDALIGGRPKVVFAGADAREFGYSVQNGMNALPGMFGGLAGIFGKMGGTEKTVRDDAGVRYPKSNVVVWGATRRYICVADAGKEAEAQNVFVHFVSSLTPDAALEEQAVQMTSRRASQIAEANGQRQQITRQMQLQGMQLQRQLSQQLAQNSADISAGIMDSWNRKQAAESRMSANYSEAVRGVNTYTTPAGGTVEMDVTADHVYQNGYGDVYGVSGNAVDQEVLNRLNWTELNRK